MDVAAVIQIDPQRQYPPLGEQPGRIPPPVELGGADLAGSGQGLNRRLNNRENTVHEKPDDEGGGRESDESLNQQQTGHRRMGKGGYPARRERLRGERFAPGLHRLD